MRFYYDLLSMPYGLVAIVCIAIVGGFTAALVVAAMKRHRATARFGDPELVSKLESFDSSGRRAVKGVLLVLSLIFAFLALGRPQWGHGTKLVPATNLDIVLVLDYSKSMYARDVVPSRIARAKAEISKLVRDLQGARFGAVAFAGEPMSFPMTSDGAAVAQFFRQIEPNDMPVGGTAIGRALERAREILTHDPRAKDHVKVIVLVTDGEDLEGDPISVAKAAATDKTRIDVVQIGNRAPEPIPEVKDGKVIGFRRDVDGSPLTTELSAAGEEQLGLIAKESGGAIVRAEKGETGIDEISRSLKRMMKEELAERVESAFDEEYMIPLAACVVLLVIEASIPEAPLPKLGAIMALPIEPKKKTRPKKKKKVAA